MNALITDFDLKKAAENLDSTRCHKQAVECKQMLKGLYNLENSKYYRDLPNRCSVCYWEYWEGILAQFGYWCAMTSAEKYEYNVDGTLIRFLRDLGYDDPEHRPWWLKEELGKELDKDDWVWHQRKLMLTKKTPDGEKDYAEYWPNLEPDYRRFYPVAAVPKKFEKRIARI